jgi:hypothetical protein
MTAPRVRPRPLGLLAFAALASACVAVERSPGVALATSPAGARVVIDGEDSGFVTPCRLGLSRRSHDVDLVLAGYEPARVRIRPGGQDDLVYWHEAYIDEGVYRFPLWLNAYDGLFPYKLRQGYEPARVFVELQIAQGGERRERGAR